ncbi:hypothetical protein ACFSKI_20165 [Pseudogracilibacillus auburnensis]|uniref:ComG operon protein 7 (ComGG) n=1 Tax=Pseudogracilibacillus auburnensis TaxID=1494959 RepID=A0A2V3VE72_9BACI|nr:hypothetical protein [Pseudogracilibacillus auburnensis]MBO1005852.1 hypothetical protein [Pseudogracilibacillus auburnensis]PXW80027.1 hypothetical protein DFR56_13110 [Pseudogracilibacillus auburnensis]
MKKRLPTMINERGFYLPYALIVSVIILSIITTSIFIYQNELNITRSLLDQIEVETLIQMGKTQFIKDEWYNHQDKGQVNYEFPPGKVHITFEWIADDLVEMEFNIMTNNQFSFMIFHRMSVGE